ncbi:MAG: Nucleotidyltransferase/DNA polymerase involved in repair-like protein [Cyanobacteria bacterium RYN_339]|nr:Nucleotidyltransferase/DNA polymerase involved in repair-like protein [Cyanobacteria bacterium RYN_339]
MDRLACVDVPSFPLQVLLRDRPDWAGHPAAVVDEDKPQGLIRWVNDAARKGGIQSGMRYATALSLLPSLRAGTISDEEVQAGVAGLLDRLHGFSPDVEPCEGEPGVFWLDAGGLEHLFMSPETWARDLRDSLAEAGFVSAVVVGFKRFGTYAVAKVLRGRKAVVFESLERETEITRSVPLTMIGLPPAVRDTFTKLGVFRVADLLNLPAHGIAKRFGAEVHRIYRFAAGELELPLSPTPVVVPIEEHVELEYREDNTQRLVFTIKPLVDRLLARLGRQGVALTELRLELHQEDAAPRLERIRTAEPTLASVAVMELVRLRLEATPFPSAVLGVVASALTVPATAAQLDLFAQAPRRDLAAAARAFARLKAAFGADDVVVKAVAHDRHMPEGYFRWEPLDSLAVPQPRLDAPATLVRRILARPVALRADDRRQLDGWMPLGLEPGPVDQLDGPYRLAGGWWRKDVQRDYYFLHLRRGMLIWVFYDRAQRGWFLQGEIG